MTLRAVYPDFSALNGLTAADVAIVTYQDIGFGIFSSFPFYELDLQDLRITQSVGSPPQLTTVFEGRVTAEDVRLVQERLGGNEIAERLADLGRAGKRSLEPRVCLDGSTATLTATFTNGTRYKTVVNLCAFYLTKEQDSALSSLLDVASRYCLDHGELANRSLS